MVGELLFHLSFDYYGENTLVGTEPQGASQATFDHKEFTETCDLYFNPVKGSVGQCFPGTYRAIDAVTESVGQGPGTELIPLGKEDDKHFTELLRRRKKK